MKRYDVFVSYAWADREDSDVPARRSVLALVDALRRRELDVFLDEHEIDSWESISARIRGALASSRCLLAWYSTTYPTRRACAAELTAALLADTGPVGNASRVLVVNPESDRDHIIEPQLVDRLDEAAPHPDDHTAIEALADRVKRHLESVSGTFGERHRDPTHWYPRQRLGSARFVGRSRDLWRVHAALTPVDPLTAPALGGPSKSMIVHGLGGQGKTLLAEEYALRFSAAWPGGIFWLSASLPEDADAAEVTDVQRGQFADVAKRLGIRTGGRTADDIEADLGDRLAESGEPYLWIIDDLPPGLDYDAVTDWFAPHPATGSTLITSRSAEYTELNTGHLDLRRLPPEDGLELLRRHLPEVDEVGAAELLTRLSGHAQAVDVAGRFLAQAGAPPLGEYVSELDDPAQDALELAADPAFGQLLPTGHEVSVASTLLRSVQHPSLGDEARALLDLAGVLPDTELPVGLIVTILQTAWGLDDDVEARTAAVRAIASTEQLALARSVDGDEEATVAVHGLVSYVWSRRGDLRGRQAIRDAAVGALATTLGEPDATLAGRSRAADLAVARRLAAAEIRSIAQCELVGAVADWDKELGRSRSALASYERQLTAWARLVDDADLRPYRTLKNAAWCQHLLGDGLKARTRFNAVIKAPAVEVAPLLVASAQSELCAVEAMLGSYQQAISHGRAAVDTYAHLAGDDRGLLSARHNLASTYLGAGDYTAALTEFTELLDDRVRILGPDHPHTLITRHQLATTHLRAGNHTQALTQFTELLNDRLRILGPDHPNTLTTRHSLATIYLRAGNHTQA
ncbi:MAG: tetratricopeptide repeat protein, partial [Actinomycetota bacterium]